MEGTDNMSPKATIDTALHSAPDSLLLLATVNENGVPHLAAASSVNKAGSKRIAVREWFCPQTVANAIVHRPVSLVIWNPADDSGHQLVGRVTEVTRTAMMNGYLPEEVEEGGGPQEQRQLTIDVETILVFSRAPHSDKEE